MAGDASLHAQSRTHTQHPTVFHAHTQHMTGDTPRYALSHTHTQHRSRAMSNARTASNLTEAVEPPKKHQPTDRGRLIVGPDSSGGAC